MTASCAAAERPKVWPLTQAQRGLWFLDTFNPDSPFYVIATGVRLRGPLDTAALRAALSDTVAHQPALRTRFVSLNGRPYQVFGPPQPVDVPLVDLTGMPEAEAERAALARCDELAIQPFDLIGHEKFQAELLRLADDHHVLLFALHHIVFDAWSTQVMLENLAAAYDARRTGAVPELPPLATTVGALAEQQEARYSRDSPATADAMAYWRTQLQGARRLELPTDHVRPEHRRFTGATLVRDLDAATTAGIRRLASAAGVTPFHVLLTAFTLMLARVSGQRDVTVGIPLAGRTRPEHSALIGFFVNTLPLRVDLDGADTFAEAMARHWPPMLDLFSQQEFPFAMLVDELRPERSASRNPLFDVVFQTLPAPGADLRLGAASVEVFGGQRPAAQFDLSCDVHDLAEHMRIVFEYSDELFAADTMAAYQAVMVATLRDAVADGQRPRLPIAEPVGLPSAASSCSGVTPPEWVEGGLAGLVRSHAQASPDASAVRCGETELSYSGLDQAATELAARLISAGVRPGDPVGLLAERSVGAAVGMLAAMRCGGTYVPLDIRTPPARIGVLLDQVRCDVVLVDETTGSHPALDGRQAIPIGPVVPARLTATQQASVTAASEGIGADTPAYLIFTSGSTGRPKAVLVAHDSALHLASAAAGVYELTDRDRVLQMASAAVDVSIEEFFGTWWAGSCAVMHLAASEDLDLLIRRRALTVLNLPASLWQEWTRHLTATRTQVPRSVRLVIAGSERVDPSAVRVWHDGCGLGVRLLNAYGSTEASVTSVVYDTAHLAVDAARTANVPIGAAIPGVCLYVLGREGVQVPPGIPGELAIGGPGVALGYLDDPAATAERFCPDPFADVPGARLYRTGDRVRELPSGNLDFLGRTDTQVKIRGSRVDLAEIERTAAQVPGVSAFVADVRDMAGAGERLVGYVRPILGNAESERAGARVDEWRRIHDDAAFNTVDPDNDGLVNASGWLSSYTLEPIPHADMRAWLDATVDTILEAPPGRVLEIGCGTGMVLFRVAPHAEAYIGTDIAESALRYIEQRLPKAGLADGQVRLITAPADDFSSLGDDTFDLIILNSVVQYFPAAAYLEAVLTDAWRRLRPGGRIIIGDVRDLSLLQAFHLSIARYRGCDDATAAGLAEALREAADAENELCLAPSYFTTLAARLDPRVAASAQLRAKHGRAETEMNRFRYDVVLAKAGHSAKPVAGQEIMCHHGAVDAGKLTEILRSAAINPLLLVGVPDARAYAEATLAESLAGARHSRFAGVAAAVTADLPPMWHPDDIRDLVSRHGLAARLAPSGRALLNILVAASPELLDQLIREGAMPEPSPYPDGAANQPLRATRHRRIIADVRAHLQAYLPAAMVPGHILIIDEIPTTISGKVDRGRLPDPGRSAATADHVEPRTPVERALAEIWTQVLGLDACGVQDNFFEIGGDSISWLQIMSRSARAGHQFATRDIFSNQTIEALAAHWARTDGAAADLAEVPPSAVLSPIQHWFFEAFDAGRHRQNQSQWYSLNSDVTTDALERALAAVLSHHEALTLSFRLTADGRRQCRGPAPAEPPLTVVDLTTAPADRRKRLRAAADQAQDSLDIERGPLTRLCLFRTPAEEPDLLFWCVHHLAVDAVSWQFLEEDLAAALDGALAGRPITLPPRTTNALTWAAWSAQEARQMSGEELDYWRRASAAPGFALPATDPEASELAAAAHVRAATVAAPQALNRTGEDVLASCLHALARILPGWTRQRAGTVWLEYHGRPMSGDGPDVSRTVGWFTALFPFLIGIDADAGGLKARLKAVPQQGLGYGRCRYLGGSPPATDANVVVNYFAPGAGADSNILRPEPHLSAMSGPPFAGDSVIPFAAEINWYLDRDGTLTVEASLAARHFPADAADRFIDELRAAAAEEFTNRAVRPSQGEGRFALLPDTAHRSPAMAAIVADPEIADGYQLTPIQRTMLYRHLIDPAGDLNYNASVYTLLGELDTGTLAAAWSALTSRHEVLRTSFQWDGFDDPLQLVHRSEPQPPRELDWSALDDSTAESRLRGLLDAERADPPALSGAPPFRLTLIRLASDRHWLLWSDHHILLDGWSSGILVDELLGAYADLAAGRTPLASAPAPVPYRDFVGWLRQLGTSAASRYWAEALQGFARPTPLPLTAPASAVVGTAEQFDYVDQNLDEALAGDVRRLAHQERTTVGNVLNAAWAALLQRYSGDERVVFGIAQNGRPAALGDVTAMVGLYANTMPLCVPVTDSATVTDLLEGVTRASWQLADVAGSGSLWDVHDWAGVAVGRPLFDSVVVVQNLARPEAYGDDRPVRARISHAETMTGCPLTLVADPEGGALRLVWRTGCLDARAASDLLSVVVSVLRQFVLGPPRVLAELRMTLPRREEAPPAQQRRPGQESDPPCGETEMRVAAIWCRVLDLPTVGRSVNLFDLGANSLSAQRLHAMLGAEFDRQIPLVEVFGFPTVAAMAAHLDGRPAGHAATARAGRMALRREALRPQPDSARRHARHLRRTS